MAPERITSPFHTPMQHSFGPESVLLGSMIMHDAVERSVNYCSRSSRPKPQVLAGLTRDQLIHKLSKCLAISCICECKYLSGKKMLNRSTINLDNINAV